MLFGIMILVIVCYGEISVSVVIDSFWLIFGEEDEFLKLCFWVN